MDAQTATLEVSVQGVSLGGHHVSVVFNGVTLGALDFAGQTKKAAVFPVDSHLLRDGDNQVQLVSGAPGDVSLTDYLRLNYLHSMRADDDRLRFSAPAGVVSVGGFTTPDVRVFDVTDPRDHLGRGRFDLVPSKLVDAGAMETASDDWFADFDDDAVADLAVGRLPVRTQAEAAVVVNKIVSRTGAESEPSALLVADRDGADGYSFESATNGLQSLLPEGVEVSRVNRRGQDAATVRSQIVAGVNAGPLLVNWMGHGSIDVWTGEGLLRGADAPALTNGSRLPLFVMMTCLNGYYAGTGLDSLAESMLKAEGGGAYAVWASTGMTEPFAQAAANRELYRIIFSEGGGRLGDVVRRAKYATADRDVRRTWVFFGDPSSRLR